MLKFHLSVDKYGGQGAGLVFPYVNKGKTKKNDVRETNLVVVVD